MDSNYWDNIYSSKSEKEVSWFQEAPTKSLELIFELNLPKDSSIIDVGGGDSRLVDKLLGNGFSNITILDISEVSLAKAKARLGVKANDISFVISDVTHYHPTSAFDLWHDRATFHFLTEKRQVESYLEIVSKALKPGGNLIISTFSKNGPQKCSGLPIHQYSDQELKELFGRYFTNTKCFEHTHTTPWGTSQSFVYCGFKKRDQ